MVCGKLDLFTRLVSLGRPWSTTSTNVLLRPTAKFTTSCSFCIDGGQPHILLGLLKRVVPLPTGAISTAGYVLAPGQRIRAALVRRKLRSQVAIICFCLAYGTTVWRTLLEVFCLQLWFRFVQDESGC